MLFLRPRFGLAGASRSVGATNEFSKVDVQFGILKGRKLADYFWIFMVLLFHWICGGLCAVCRCRENSEK